MSFIFTNDSGYQLTIDKLVSQVSELVDESTTPERVFKDSSIIDYTFGTLNKVVGLANYPLFIMTNSDEGTEEESGSSSISSIDCYMCFNNADENFNKTINRIFSKLRKIFKDDHNGWFQVSNIIRSETAPSFLTSDAPIKPFWSIKFTVTAQQIIY